MERKSKALAFSCGHVSEDADPWSYVSNSGILDAETRLLILEHIYKEPKTVTQLAHEFGLSQPAVHRHVMDMLHVGIIREADLSDGEKRFRVEKYYEPNFPVIFEDDYKEFQRELETISRHIVETFEKEKEKLKEKFENTHLQNIGWSFEDITFYLFDKSEKIARDQLQNSGFFPKKEWIFFAEESNTE
jgi:DNA-binding transcriptional ArsR family regulator